MEITRTNTLSQSQKQDIIRLWNKEYPAHLSYGTDSEFDSYLAGLSNPLHLTISDQHEQIMAWLITFTRDASRWFAMIIDQSLQGQGIGSRLLDEAKKSETELNGWATDHNRDVRADGRPYPSPIGFYLKNGFEVLTDTRLEKGALSTVKIQWRKARMGATQ
ncbi:MAG: GNAT family N-acetyltransferase [Roseivirga sp.]|nr:GNAT family N-acetyltransferase [Roseivirga sp.]